MPIFKRRQRPAQNRAAENPISGSQRTPGVPAWAMSSVIEWLGPFFRGEGLLSEGSWDQPGRDFLKEVERNLQILLNWRDGRHSAAESLFARMTSSDAFLERVLDFALRNILLGYTFQDADSAARELDRILRESGSVWEVSQVPGRTEYRLRQRVSETATAAIAAEAERPGGASEHLSRAWTLAYGREPNPGEAYREAVKAVEAAAIPVVLPQDPVATLGKVIAAMRQAPGKFEVVLQRGVADRFADRQQASELLPAHVIVLMLDLLWRNQTDRHAVGDEHPPVAITQPQAELAVHLAVVLVHAFRSGAVRRVG